MKLSGPPFPNNLNLNLKLNLNPDGSRQFFQVKLSKMIVEHSSQTTSTSSSTVHNGLWWFYQVKLSKMPI
jgi:hypothetical protein